VDRLPSGDFEEGTMTEILIPDQSVANGQRSTAIQLDMVGHGKGVFVSKDEIVVLMAVANETKSTIVLSNRTGIVGGFESSPMPTVKVSSGVSVKIPVVIPRIACFEENGEITDVTNELITHTALKWESEVTDKSDVLQRGKRQGRVRIPSRCLREMIQDHKSFLTRICKPPLKIEMVAGKSQSDSQVSVEVGCPLDISVEACVQDWVPIEFLQQCTARLEFCCARKNSGSSAKAFLKDNGGTYIWCGQTKKSIRFGDMSHRARVCFIEPGDYVISACVRIKRSEGVEESWWAPSFNTIKVPRTVVTPSVT